MTRFGSVIAAPIVVAVLAGCGSTQATPLSVAKTEATFASAGIPLRAFPGHVFAAKGAHLDRLPTMLTWGRADSLSLVLVYPTTVDAVQAVRKRAPVPAPHEARAQNVVALTYGKPLDDRVAAAIRRLRSLRGHS